MKGPKDARNIHNIIFRDQAYIFLGATKKFSRDTWKWIDGSPVDQFYHWKSGQPDTPNSQFCLRMDYDDDSKWRDIECYKNTHVDAVLCQQETPGIVYRQQHDSNSITTLISLFYSRLNIY